MAGHFYYGDNLPVMQQHIADHSVDLIYLDPPFKSDATYNMLFRAPDGVTPAESPVRAFASPGAGAPKPAASSTRSAAKTRTSAPNCKQCVPSSANAVCSPTSPA